MSGVARQGMIIFMITRPDSARWAVQLSVARQDGWRGWGRASGDFERALRAQASKIVIAPRIYSERRRGRDYVRVTIAMTIVAADVAEALAAAWWAFRKAAGDQARTWDKASATADVRPELAGPAR